MGLISSIFGPKKAAQPALPAPKADAPGAPVPVSAQPTIDDAANLPPITPPAKLGWIGGIKQRLKGEVDEYVNEKTEEARAMAEQFRADTLSQVKTQAFELLDITEQRIDKKLAEIEKLLDERLQQELKMRLRAMIWTLAFVLLMAIVSMVYVWAKHEAGLDKAPAESTRK
ncbi:hypothetical protein PLCT2_01974 [Planctomycetaceae bacterium]|nr:hypothetical protein PLCT2_01974 [Planctomycetaceae bacterium]